MATPALDTQGVVLVVDDEPDNCDLMEALLSSEGYTVLQAIDGQTALEMLESEAIDIVLLDILMPGMDGWEVCRRIRADAKHAFLPIVMITALADQKSRVKGKELGADDYLYKPIDENEVIARVKNLLQLKLYREFLEGENTRLSARVQRDEISLRQALGELEVMQKEVRRAREEIIRRLMTAAEFRDDETRQHIERMSLYCELLARLAGLDDAACHQLRIASPMHDIGKIGTPDSILSKPARLTSEEFAIMQRHAAIGHRILSNSQEPLIKLAAVVAYTHHERWDGAGYPRGLSGEAIPLEGRIAAVADVFDALTTPRVYKPAFSVAQSVEILNKARGTHLDAKLVELFLANLDHALVILERFPDSPAATG